MPRGRGLRYSDLFLVIGRLLIPRSLLSDNPNGKSQLVVLPLVPGIRIPKSNSQLLLVLPFRWSSIENMISNISKERNTQIGTCASHYSNYT